MIIFLGWDVLMLLWIIHCFVSYKRYRSPLNFNYLKIWRNHGNRRAGQNHHDRATADANRATLDAILAAFGTPSPPGAGEAARDASDPRARDSARLSYAQALAEAFATAPDGIEPIYAWRAWSVNGDGTLMATNQQTMWLPKQATEAYCRTHSLGDPTHIAPLEGCRCGLYAAKDPANIMCAPAAPFIYGQVALWGKIIEYTEGYRGQFGYPAEDLKLVMPSGDGKRLRKHVERLYGVKVTLSTLSECNELMMKSGHTAGGLNALMLSNNFFTTPPTVTTSGSILRSPMNFQSTTTTNATLPNFVAYASHQVFQAAQRKAFKAVTEQLKAKQESDAKKRALVLASLQARGLVIPKPGESAQELGQALPDA